MDRFFELRVFVQVVEAGSLSGAADQLNVAKSVVSRSLKALESRLGVQLMMRTTRRQHLTEAGEAFYERSLSVLAELEAAEESVSEADHALGGRLRIAAPQSYGLAYVAPVVLEFIERYPNGLIDLDLDDRLGDLADEGFDMAIRVGVLEDSALRARRLSRVRVMACASPGYLEQFGVPRTPDELKHHHCIRYSQVSRMSVWRYRDPANRTGQVRVPIRLLSSSGDFMREAAIAGFGIALMPDFLVDKAIAAGTLVTFLDDHEWFETAPGPAVHAVFPPTRHRSRRLGVFADFLAERLSG